MARILGIDLGTTNSVVAYMAGEKPEIIPNDVGDRITPSIVYYGDDGNVLVGKKARRAAGLSPERAVYSIKRHMEPPTVSKSTTSIIRLRKFRQRYCRN